MRKTPLNSLHHRLGARMVEFAGWQMPLRYTSEIEEHLAVRHDAGMFDVSHMTRIDIRGTGAIEFLRYLLANDVAKLKQASRALYSCMLNEQGGIIDDVVAFYRDESHFRLVTNAATREKDWVWINRQAKDFEVGIYFRDDLAMIAVQGPNAREMTDGHLPAALQEQVKTLKPFAFAESESWMAARTGYTGEDGYELMLPNEQAPRLWEALLECGVQPCGLVARDTLRMEAGFNLYGQEMDEDISPLECGLARTVALESPDRKFIGRSALERQLAMGVKWWRAGLILQAPGVLRRGQKVKLASGEGEITSGGFSPTLQSSIALARLPTTGERQCQVEIRGCWKLAQIVQPPFVRHGKIMIEIATDKGDHHE